MKPLNQHMFTLRLRLRSTVFKIRIYVENFRYQLENILQPSHHLFFMRHLNISVKRLHVLAHLTL